MPAAAATGHHYFYIMLVCDLYHGVQRRYGLENAGGIGVNEGNIEMSELVEIYLFQVCYNIAAGKYIPDNLKLSL
jgi:hypothetical protein